MSNKSYLRILVCSNCQSNCIFCHKDGAEGNNNLSLSKFKFIFNKYRKNVTKIRFSGGEPLLNKDILNMAIFVKPVVNNVRIVTNGLLLNKYKAKIKKFKYPNLTISIHSLYPKTYNKITGLSLKQHKQIITSIKELSPYINIKLNVVFLKGINTSYAELKKIIDFGTKYNLDIRFQELDIGIIDSNFPFNKYHYSVQSLKKDLEQITPLKFKRINKNSVWLSRINNSEISIKSGLCYNKKCNECDRTRPLLIMPDGTIKTCRLCIF